MPELSIIIVSFNIKNFITPCLQSLNRSEDEIKKEIIIIDNNSSDGSAEYMKTAFPGVLLIKNDQNIGFAAAVNQGIRIAKGRYYLLLNPDAFVNKHTIGKTVAYMDETPDCGILGCRIIDRKGELASSARHFPTPFRLFLSLSGIGHKFPNNPFLRGVDEMRWDHRSIRETDWIPGCFFLMRKKMIDEIGVLDSRYFLYYEEIDLCLRAKREGWKVIFYPYGEVTHLGAESAKAARLVMPDRDQIEDIRLQSELLYFRKHYGITCALSDIVFITLLDIIFIIKKMLMWHEAINIGHRAKHIVDALKCFIMPVREAR